MSWNLRRIARFTATVVLIVLGLSLFWSYRVRAAETEAAEYLPIDVTPVLVPKGTAIEAELRNQIIAAGVGDSVMATVLEPVVIDGRTVIPPGAQLTGNLQSLSIQGHITQAAIHFTALRIGERLIAIQTDPVAFTTKTQSETDILSSAAKTLTGASIGAAVGAGSQDLRLVRRGMFEALDAMPALEPSIRLRVPVSQDLEI
jgi:hypothetical protein